MATQGMIDNSADSAVAAGRHRDQLLCLDLHPGVGPISLQHRRSAVTSMLSETAPGVSCISMRTVLWASAHIVVHEPAKTVMFHFDPIPFLDPGWRDIQSALVRANVRRAFVPVSVTSTCPAGLPRRSCRKQYPESSLQCLRMERSAATLIVK